MSPHCPVDESETVGNEGDLSKVINAVKFPYRLDLKYLTFSLYFFTLFLHFLTLIPSHSGKRLRVIRLS